VTIRPIEPGDHSEWLRMRCQLWPGADADHAEETRAYLQALAEGAPPPDVVLVSEASQGGLDGFVEISVRSYAEGCEGPAPYIEGWFVDAAARGRGVGRGLVQAAEDWARAQGYRELASDAALGNEASQRAHLALGFEEVERAVQYRKSL
jgi:aminoglycoside 6'-N-acetyltransferase I